MCDDSLIEKFLEHYRFIGKSERTIQQYSRLLMVLDKFLAENYALGLNQTEHVKQVTGEMLASYQHWLRDVLKLSPTNEAAHVAAAKSFFKFVKPYKNLANNPAELLASIAVSPKEQIHFDWGEAGIMVEKFESRNMRRDKIIAGIALFVALRVSAIANLNIGDFDQAHRKLSYINKGGARKSIIIPVELADAIADYIDEERVGASEEDPLFLSERGNRISTDAIRHICDNMGRVIQKHVTPHSLRRTCLSRVNEVRGDDMASMIAQHQDKKTTARYIYNSTKDMDDMYNEMGIFSFSGGEVLTKK